MKFSLKTRVVTFTAAAIFLAFFIGYSIGAKSLLNNAQDQIFAYAHPISEQNTNYKFISPLLTYDENKEFYEFNPLQNKISDIINKFKSQGKVSEVGFYFREGGHWAGINEETKFYPASLMKVPLMIAYFKLAETQPYILETKYKFQETQDYNAYETRKPSKTIEPGQEYSVLDLIKYMIIYSDNNAAYLLQKNIDQNSFNEIYTDLGMQIPDSTKIGSQDYFSAKDYSLFFRVLRGATYLSKKYSEQALEILSQVDFNSGLSKNLPEGTPLVHKFGEFVTPTSDGTYDYELHDCGYVFGPTKTYFLCVMTKGKNYEALPDVISQISSLVYDEVKEGYK